MIADAAGSRRSRVALSLGAAALYAAAIWLPFWKVDLAAPQYPTGLQLVAYGTEVRGDLREINIINHYVGMEHIDTTPAPEMSLFHPTMAAVVVLALLAPLHRRLNQLALLAATVTPMVILVDLQRWLHRFGTNLDPKAALRVEPFTPWVIGTSRIGNFESSAMVSWGFLAMAAAALLLGLALRWSHRSSRPAPRRAIETAVASTAVALLVVGPIWAGVGTTVSPPVNLQTVIDSAPAGGVVTVPAGEYRGPLRIVGPMTVEGEPGATIDGGGRGSVVTVEGEEVTFRGFTVRNSGRNITAEPAGIKVTGSGHVIADNDVVDVYFGIHLAGGSGNGVIGNRVAPGRGSGVRPGHAISLWHQSRSRVVGNAITAARDGIYLSFADDVEVRGNTVRDCRYAVHSMYSENSSFVDNRFVDNLLGAALMYSNGLEMRCNRIERHRRGATAYGILLKDIDDLVLEGNVIAANRVGIYADSTPLGPGRDAIVRANLLYGNHVALSLQSNVALRFTGNRVEANLLDVRSEGRGLSESNRWSEAGSGNYWDTYLGYDRDGDGIGDLPHRYEVVMNELTERTPLARAFAHTPASLALERAARLFPLYRAGPLLIDDAPLMRSPPLACGGAL